MNLSDLREKRAKLYTDLAEMGKVEAPTSETRAKFDAVAADLDVLDADIKRAERLEAVEAEQRSRPANRPAPEAEVNGDAEVRSNYLEYLRRGVINTRDLTAGNTTVAIPTLFDATVNEAQKSYGDILNLVDIITTDNGNPIDVVFDDDTANGLSSVTVGTAVGSQDPTITGATLSVGNYTTKIVKVGYDLLSDSGFDIDAFIRDKMLARYYRGVSNLIINGGTNVQSLTSAFTAGVQTGTTGVVKYADLVSLMVALDPAYQGNACWVMTNATLGVIMNIVDAQNRPIFLPNYGSADQGFRGYILGYPVRIVPQLAAVATGNVPILFGDFKAGYTFRQQRPGVVVQRLNELYAPGMEIGYVGFARVGGIAKTYSTTNPVLGLSIK